MSSLEQAQQEYEQFLVTIQSVMLSTVSPEGKPNASYAPFVTDAKRNIYLFISGLSTHTQNLQAQPLASLLFIEDEQNCANIFARKRLTYDCEVMWLARETPEWIAIAAQFQTQFGEIITMLRSLADFQIVCLKPRSGRFVLGFGAAYRITGDNLDQLVHLQSGN